MILQKLEVGQLYPGYTPKQEGVVFEMRSSGLEAIISFNNPTADEIEQFNDKMSFQVKFVVLDDIIFLLFKIGNLNWMDAPYSPHLSLDLGLLDLEIEDGKGYSLLVTFTDYPAGIIKSLRYIGLGTSFSTDLKKAIINTKNSTFFMADYHRKLQNIYAKYSTAQMVKMAKSYYKL